MAMVILGFVICFSLGACLGLLIAGIFAPTPRTNGPPDKAPTPKEKENRWSSMLRGEQQFQMKSKSRERLIPRREEI